MVTLKVQLPPLHAGQQAVDEHPARFKVLACGRRWGKTRYGTRKCIEIALRGGHAWWVAPSYGVAVIGWRGIKALAQQIPGYTKNDTERMVTLPGGGWVQVRSADDPDSLRGVGLDFVVIDEAAFVAEEAWIAALRPALSDREGHALIISTPRGRNWFWHAYQRGRDELQPEWKSWSFPTTSNPHINPAEVEAAKSQLPEDIFRQEYLAVFLENAGTVFRNIEACLKAPKGAKPADHEGHRIAFGVDWGKHNDFTCISIGCLDCRVELALDRFNQIDYAFQRKRLKAHHEVWQPQVVIAESNAMGEPIIEEVRREGIPVRAFTTTATSKPPLIENLALALERTEWQFLDDPAGKAELESYERKVNAVTGRSTYSAPEGLHDDTVMGRALMVSAGRSLTPSQMVDFA